MMGSGPAGSSHVAEAVHNAAGVAALKSLSALLDMVLNPDAAKAALKVLTDKSEAIEEQLRQIEEQYKALMEIRDNIAGTQQEIAVQKADLVAKNADLVSRENDLIAKLNDIAKREQNILSDNVRLNDWDQALANRSSAIDAGEKEAFDRIKKVTEDSKNEIERYKHDMETKYSKLMADANSFNAEASKNIEHAKATLANAIQQKEILDKRAASIQKIMQGE